MKLNPEQKFVLPDDDGNLILITDIDFDFELLQNKVISMTGVKFDIDYENNTIEFKDNVEIQTSFNIENICKNYKIEGN